ncbi:MAG: UDP-N-acetylmuramoyl-L-alanyl-D-glutamate--2,6-diaminopimelate ligase, partial [Erysipelotrichaceae bacterium]|nr:UDP-N-acetylmuramoyl-L-alanyl-D-glutamate--2,6-diaminopimelate ligase [Erysipelotrichaceae bacterium]
MNSVELLRKAGIETKKSQTITKIVRYGQDADNSSIYVDVSKRFEMKYIQMALDSGAIVLTEKQIEGCIWVEDAALALTKLLQIFYGFPYRQLKLIGVTGTCGKSTVIHLLKDCLKSQGIKSCAVMSGKVLIEDEVIMTSNTTPDVSFLIPLMKRCIESGISVFMMEVSSEAYVSHRIDGLYYDVMIGTVITSDHLDTHHTIENYHGVKQKILSLIKPGGVLILNADDPIQMKWRSSIDAYSLTYGFSSSNFQVSDCQETLESTSFSFHQMPLVTNLLSKANVLNLAAVMSCAFVLDLKMKDVYLWASQVKGCPGRFEVIHDCPLIMVDYAHTEKAAETLLSFVRRNTDQRVICVFGCGGQRDVSKRPKMGKIVCQYADIVIVTSDNPRDEDPNRIINQIVQGCTKEVHIEPDRMKAIQFALETCTKN